MTSDIHLVWFKKDLRVIDHQPLSEASHSNKTLGIYILEDEWLASEEFSHYHLQFLKQSLIELEQQLSHYQIPLLILQGECIQVLNTIQRIHTIHHLYSHQETGVWWTYKRDLRVKNWCQEKGIEWREYKQFAVIRKLKNRDSWNSKRNKIIKRKIIPPPKSQNTEINIDKFTSIKVCQIECQSNPNLQPGGRKNAVSLLNSFLTTRGQEYQANMSSPNSAFEQCSRLSPYISWGTISITEITNSLKQTRNTLDTSSFYSTKKWLRSLKSFESRLWWHCHFIQKLESEPEIEFKNMNHGFDGLRENDFNQEKFQAWCSGETGYPMIDACMRALRQHGWINFRMRAMLISFACYQLWLHWRKPAQHLARLFTDFEPGIHYSQVQMQSGVTGINTIRIYSPIKQAQVQDPDGVFIKKYCPELIDVDPHFIHEPHKMSLLEQKMAGLIIGKDYPAPIVEHKHAYKHAREKIFTWRSRDEVKNISKQVYLKHGSRKNKYFPNQHRHSFGKFVANSQKNAND